MFPSTLGLVSCPSLWSLYLSLAICIDQQRETLDLLTQLCFPTCRPCWCPLRCSHFGRNIHFLPFAFHSLAPHFSNCRPKVVGFFLSYHWGSYIFSPTDPPPLCEALIALTESPLTVGVLRTTVFTVVPEVYLQIISLTIWAGLLLCMCLTSGSKWCNNHRQSRRPYSKICASYTICTSDTLIEKFKAKT